MDIQAREMTGHAVGGVCPLRQSGGGADLSGRVPEALATVFPAAGSSNSAIELTCDELEEYSRCESWIDVCKGWQTEDSGV